MCRAGVRFPDAAHLRWLPHQLGIDRASMPATGVSADASCLFRVPLPRFQGLMSDGTPELLLDRRPTDDSSRGTSGPSGASPPTQRGRSLTPRQSCDDVTTTTQLRLTGLHAGAQGSVRGCCATINFGTCRISALMLMRMCGHGRVRIASGEDDNHFARCAALTDMSKRGGNLVEREGTVDVDPDLPGNA